MVLVDTSILIDFINMNKYREIITTLLAKKQFTTTEIIIMEVLQGIKDDKFYETTKSFLETLPLVSLKYEDFLKAANIYRTCRKNGITIRKSIDCIIAALAINNNLKLLSNDRDFNNIQSFFELLRLFDDDSTSSADADWESLIPILIPSRDLTADRPYPPLLRTNLLLKAIDGKTTLLDLMAKLNIKENELVEDIKLLYDTQWIKFTPSQETIFKRFKNEL